MNPRQIDVHIEEIVLHGFPPGQRAAVVDALREELARLLAADTALPAVERGALIRSVDAGSFTLREGAAPRTVGVQVARSVHRGLSR